ncbi:HEPN domain-containing protein [uncultured Mucilaginibacter sp.]|uniref:HEPN domain-containing protein n=1 Tax=uncultured Mucilaginibacter sp. TaxID=797541 RepID=UPI0025F2131D|nr:HEPN domain-containing protein [uncultured Mucilaginibacter sp.]
MDRNEENVSNELTNGVPIIGQDIAQQPKDNEKSERAFKIFNSGIKRAQNLLSINIGSSDEQLPIANDKLLDSYRAVIVLSISALDAYIKTFLIVEIKQRLDEKNLSADLKQYIKDELFTKDTLHQHVLESNFYEKVIEKFDDDFEKKSFQGQKSIDKYMKLAGFNSVFKMISRSADKSADNLLSDVERFTQRRHLIVHCGDHDLNQTQLTENRITIDDASNCIELVSLIAREIHKLSKEK